MIEHAIAVMLLLAGILSFFRRATVEQWIGRFAMIVPRWTEQAPVLPLRLMSSAISAVLLMSSLFLLYRLWL